MRCNPRNIREAVFSDKIDSVDLVKIELFITGTDIRQLETLVSGTDERVYKLTETFWPGPLTIVLPDVDYILDEGKTTVGIESAVIKLLSAPGKLKLHSSPGSVPGSMVKIVDRQIPGLSRPEARHSR